MSLIKNGFVPQKELYIMFRKSQKLKNWNKLDFLNA